MPLIERAWMEEAISGVATASAERTVEAATTALVKNILKERMFSKRRSKKDVERRVVNMSRRGGLVRGQVIWG